jgi:ABC-2 type transport system ATP-binding protein
MNEEQVISVEKLEKVFKDFWLRPKTRAVDGISFSVKRGEVFGLLGPNGSGKSTTIKLLLGLLKPTSGVISILGKSPTHTATKHRIGYLPELSYLYKYLTPRETLRYYAGLFGMQGKHAEQRIDNLIAQVGLANAADRAVGEFSKGMARRVGLAQALLNNPEIVILDEPTSGLDPIGRYDVKQLIKGLAAEGKTVILSSHLLSEIEDVCSSVIVLSQGKIIAQGDLYKILAEQNRVRLDIEGMSLDALPKIAEEITAAGGKYKAGHPRMPLEEYFLKKLGKNK